MSAAIESTPTITMGLVQDGTKGIIMIQDQLSEDAFDSAYRALYRMVPREEGEPCVTGPEYEAYLERDDPRIAFEFIINCRRALINNGRVVETALARAGVEVELEEKLLVRQS